MLPAAVLISRGTERRHKAPETLAEAHRNKGGKQITRQGKLILRIKVRSDRRVFAVAFHCLCKWLLTAVN